MLYSPKSVFYRTGSPEYLPADINLAPPKSALTVGKIGLTPKEPFMMLGHTVEKEMG